MSSSTTSDSKKQAGLHEHVQSLLKGGHLSQALSTCTAALKKTLEKNAEARVPILLDRSAVLLLLNKPIHAKNDAVAAISLDSTCAKAHYRQASAEAKLFKFEDAKKSYQRGLKQCHADQPIHTLLSKGLSDVQRVVSTLVSNEEIKNPDKVQFNALVKWMSVNGAVFPFLFMKYYGEEYRGVHALTDIPSSTPVLYVPKKCIMSQSNANNSPINRTLRAMGHRVTSYHSTIAAYLLEERQKGKTGFYWPYIDILPKKFNNIPTGFTDTEKKEWLQGSMALRKISSRMEDLRGEYTILCKVAEFKQFSFDDFVWARQVVITRIFGYGTGKEKDSGLVPYADMLNHKIGCETTWGWNSERKGFVIKSTTLIREGQEIFDGYGVKCNSRFFVNYGFSIDDNEEANEAMFDFNLWNESDHVRIGLFNMYNVYGEDGVCTFQVPANYTDNKVLALFSFLRCLASGQAPNYYANALRIKAVSKKNERKALILLRECCEEMLSEFKRTLDEDNKILEANELTMYSNERNALIQCRGEKQVYHFYLELCELGLRLLDTDDWNEVKRTVETLRLDEKMSRFDQYVTVAIVPLFV